MVGKEIAVKKYVVRLDVLVSSAAAIRLSLQPRRNAIDSTS